MEFRLLAAGLGKSRQVQASGRRWEILEFRANYNRKEVRTPQAQALFGEKNINNKSLNKTFVVGDLNGHDRLTLQLIIF